MSQQGNQGRQQNNLEINENENTTTQNVGGHSKSSFKREIHCSRGLHQDINKKTSNKQFNLTPMGSIKRTANKAQSE